MASSSPPPPLPPSLSLCRLPPPIWSHDEILALIKSYRHKYHSPHHLNLGSSDWDEDVSDLSDRSLLLLLLPSPYPKTPIQCRHKIEKLRKRFRSNRRRSLDRNPLSPPTSSWPFFPLMESLNPPIPNIKFLWFVNPKAIRSKMKLVMERKRKEMEDGILVAMRNVGDGFKRMERVKLDTVREMEKMRIEIELKRMEMILDSQQRIVDASVKGVVGGERRKKGKVSLDGKVFDE